MGAPAQPVAGGLAAADEPGTISLNIIVYNHGKCSGSVGVCFDIPAGQVAGAAQPVAGSLAAADEPGALAETLESWHQGLRLWIELA